MNLYAPHGTASLPLLTRRASTAGSAISGWALLVTWWLWLTPGLASAERLLNEQIEHAVSQHLTQQLITQAIREGWQGARLDQKLLPLPADAPTSVCSQPLLVSSADNSRSVLGRQRLLLECAQPEPWRLTVSVQPSVWVQAVVATRVLERGEPISADHLQRQEVNLSKAARSVFNRIEDVIGLSPKRRVRNGQLLTRDMLASAWLIRRGEKVTVLARHGEIQASTQGLALEDGRQGMLIRVKNLASGKIIEARVTGAGAVSSVLEPSPK